MNKKHSSRKPGASRGINLFTLLLVLSLLSISSVIHAQFHLVKDINTVGAVDGSEFASLTDVDGTLYFTSATKELWKTDGTESGSVKLKDFNRIYQMKKIGSMLYFFAADVSNTISLWKSDGTAAGTGKVSNHVVNGTDMTDVNGILFFVGLTVAQGLEIWRSDGTQAGTYLVKDIMKGGGHSNATSLVSFNGKLFFVANNGTNGYEVWESDGTNAGTHIFKDIIPGKTSSAPNYLTVVGNSLFFMAKDAALGQEVWKTDGTVAGTVIVKDIKVGQSSSFPERLVAAGGLLYFRANDGQNNFQLWRSDGTESGTIKLTTSGYGWINGTKAVGSVLYYILGRQVFRTDGSVAGTQFVCEIEDFYSPKEMAEFNGSLYVASTDYYQNDLYKITGLSATIVTNINTFEDGNTPPVNLTVSNNLLFFVGNGGDESTSKLFKTDGTATGTESFLDLFSKTDDSDPYAFKDVNGKFFFNVSKGSSDAGLWTSDGTEGGTIKLTSTPVSQSAEYNNELFFGEYQYLKKTDGTTAGTAPVSNSFFYPGNLTVVGTSLFFRGDKYPNGYELCKTDGTEAGTVVVKDINVGFGSSSPEYITNVNGVAYFAAYDGFNGRELWKSDGTSAGTVMVKDINVGNASSTPLHLTALGSQLFFVAYTPATGYELWQSNGTAAGTTLVMDINPTTSTFNHIQSISVADNKLFFVALDASGAALWRTDGTVGGTIKLKDFAPDVEETIYVVKTYNNELFLLVDYGDTHELWKTNGTVAGTVLVKKIGVDGVMTPLSTIHNGKLYFTVYNKPDAINYHRREVWRTDGTSCGTFVVDFQHDVLTVAHSGTKLFASGDYGVVGRELLLLEESEISVPSCSPAARAIADTDDNEGLSDIKIDAVHYPNPFNKTFTLRVNGGENTTFNASVINISGVQVEQHQELKTNTDHTLGANWSAGLFLLKIEIDGKTVTKKVMRGSF